MRGGGGVATGSLPVRIGYRRSQISYRSTFFHKSYIERLVLCSFARFATVYEKTWIGGIFALCNTQYPLPLGRESVMKEIYNFYGRARREAGQFEVYP